LLPFRSQPPAPRLPEGYRLALNPWPDAEALNRLLSLAEEATRAPERWRLVLERSLWHLAVWAPSGNLVGFVRTTSDLALNANLWDLLSDPGDPGRDEVLAVLVHAGLGRLRRELGGCSVSLSAPPEALSCLRRVGFVVDPGGIRAMGRHLR
jgi:hypothetical protein